MVMLVLPSWLIEVIWVMPAMRPNMRSSGVATAEAMVSGLAPGKLADTVMVGYSTSGACARREGQGKASAPNSNKADAEQRGGHRPLDEGSRNVHGPVPLTSNLALAIECLRIVDAHCLHPVLPLIFTTSDSGPLNSGCC